MIHPSNSRDYLLRCERQMIARLKTEIGVERVTAQRLFLYGAGKRTLAQAKGFRAMQDAHNATVAGALVRLQLDTLLRLHALWWVTDADAFSKAVLDGKPINKLKAADGKVMTDADLYRRLAKIVPWIETVYQESSGFIHFSGQHLLAVMQVKEDEADEEDGGVILNLDPMDPDRPTTYFNQLASSFTDVTMRIAVALDVRFDVLAATPNTGVAIAQMASIPP